MNILVNEYPVDTLGSWMLDRILTERHFKIWQEHTNAKIKCLLELLEHKKEWGKWIYENKEEINHKVHRNRRGSTSKTT